MTHRPRIDRGHKTIEAMIGIYCHDHHETGADTLCPDCQELLDYARVRLDKCPFGEEKPTCSRCTIHCYKPDMRERITLVMRYAGPRMMHKHPILAMHHALDGLRKKKG